MSRLYLASASPRRADLLNNAQIPFAVLNVSELDDPETDRDVSPELFVETAATAKLRRAMSYITEDDAVVIAADTVVVDPVGNVLGKPADKEDAARMLRALSGKTHSVITGVAVGRFNGSESVFHVSTDVKYRLLSEEEIQSYVSTGEPMDKAGAYGIQERAGVFITSVNGCYFNVVGLPVERLAEVLRTDFQIDITKHWRA